MGWRTKLYLLRDENGSWDDLGTGAATIIHIPPFTTTSIADASSAPASQGTHSPTRSAGAAGGSSSVHAARIIVTAENGDHMRDVDPCDRDIVFSRKQGRCTCVCVCVCACACPPRGDVCKTKLRFPYKLMCVSCVRLRVGCASVCRHHHSVGGAAPRRQHKEQAPRAQFPSLAPTQACLSPPATASQ
ncbi:hypothetical protein EON67_11860 [archaeon]|nr:MAG: hypothetical protein EON67_11860 [archaeon]